MGRIRAMKDKAIKLSALVQFSASKASIVMSSITAITVISMKFDIRWHYALIGAAFFALCMIAFVYFSGWMREELTYNANMADLIGRLERIEKRIEKKVEQ